MRKSDPGYPLRNWVNNNEQALSLYLDKCVDIVLNRLLSLARNGQLSDDSLELMKLGLMDPIRIFPKNEPHKATKLKEGRIRLISSVSIIDNITDRCIFGLQNANEIENWKEIPSKPGMGFTSEDVDTITAEVSSYKDAKSTDASGWDWSVQGWEYDMEAEARILLMEGCTPFAQSIIRNRMWCMSLGVFILPDGSIYAQRVRGIMKSGLYVTSSSNSRIGFMDYKIIGGNRVMVQGDDTVQESVKDFTSKYLKLGHRVVETDVKEGFEFCSQHYVRGTRYSLNAAKLVFNLLHKVGNSVEDRLQRFETFLQDLGEHPEKAYYVGLLEKAGYFKGFPEVPSF